MKRILSALLFLAFMNTLSAQKILGLRAGINISNWATENLLEEDSETNSIFGYQTGLLAEFNINERLAFQPEILYIQKGLGFKLEDFGFGTASENEFVLNYLEIPMLLKIRFRPSTDAPSFYSVIGPSVGYILSGKNKATFTFMGMTESISEKIDLDDAGFSRFDFSLLAGFGINIPTGPGNIIVDFRYLLGLNNLNDESGDEIKARNRGFGFTAGYTIPLGTGKSAD